MSIDHVVQQGEHLSQIAEKYGFRNIVWNPSNADLKKLRQSPNVLMPGDKVHIPDKIQGQESCSTERTHRFKLADRRLFLHLAIKDFDDQPLAL